MQTIENIEKCTPSCHLDGNELLPQLAAAVAESELKFTRWGSSSRLYYAVFEKVLIVKFLPEIDSV